MEYVTIIVVVIFLLFLMFLKGYFDEKRFYKSLLLKFSKEKGTIPKREYTLDEMDNIKSEFLRYKNEHSIDDITASDLSLDEVYSRLNYSKSTPGDSHLYSILRNPHLLDRESFENKVEYFTENDNDRIRLEQYFHTIGRMGKTSFFDCIDFYNTISPKNLLLDYLAGFFILAGIVLIFFKPTIGIIVLIAALVYNIISYYSERGEIEPYIITFSYINRFIGQAAKISKLKIDAISDECDEIDRCVSNLKPFTKNAGIVVTGNKGSSVGVGNPFELLFDYLIMTLHLDIIKFYKMLNIIKKEKEDIESLYIILGKVESYIDVSLFRSSLDTYCVPQKGTGIHMIDGYHPLIESPVTNTIETDKCVLITGSNASGKSTFLKTVALNVLLGQSINTCLATSFISDDFALFSSMSLRDDLTGKDSYFMVEIKAMKRILDYAGNNPEKHILCFVDEVLRGTNTVERIAASTEILKYLSSINCTCYAATHDGELTYLLENIYENFHFSEDIIDNDVLFNYKLNSGRATSRNAIKLLSVMGFNESIVENASKRASKFLEGGAWV